MPASTCWQWRATSRALRPAIASAGARCAIYLFLLWNPMTYDAHAMGRVLRQHVYGPLALLILAALTALSTVFALFWTSDIGFLWFNVIGCAIVVLLSMALELVRRRRQRAT